MRAPRGQQPCSGLTHALSHMHTALKLSLIHTSTEMTCGDGSEIYTQVAKSRCTLHSFVIKLYVALVVLNTLRHYTALINQNQGLSTAGQLDFDTHDLFCVTANSRVFKKKKGKEKKGLSLT